jgi:hypothetical protein
VLYARIILTWNKRATETGAQLENFSPTQQQSVEFPTFFHGTIFSFTLPFPMSYEHIGFKNISKTSRISFLLAEIMADHARVAAIRR